MKRIILIFGLMLVLCSLSKLFAGDKTSHAVSIRMVPRNKLNLVHAKFDKLNHNKPKGYPLRIFQDPSGFTLRWETDTYPKKITVSNIDVMSDYSFEIKGRLGVYSFGYQKEKRSRQRIIACTLMDI